MGGKSKHFLKEEAVPAIFSFAPEPARKGRESLSHVYKEDIQELELTSEKCIGTESLIAVVKAVGKHTTTKSVRTQYNPLLCIKQIRNN